VSIEIPHQVETKVPLKPDNVHVRSMKHLPNQLLRPWRALKLAYLDDIRIREYLIEDF
jgi:hypothetical protein